MKRKIVGRIVIITMFALFLLGAFTVAIVNFTNYKAMEENIERIGSIYEGVLTKMSREDIIKRFGGNDEDLAHITIFDEDKKVIVDNIPDKMNDIMTMYKDDDISEIIAGQKFKKLDLDSENNQLWLNYSFRVEHKDFEGGYFLINVGYVYENNMHRFYLSIPAVILALIAIAIVATFFTNRLIKTAVSPFESIQETLENINKGQYHQVTVDSKYEDINNVVREINDVSAKISNSINYLNYEKRKSEFLLDNMRQGVLAISKKGKIILSNNVIQNIFHYDKAVLGCELSFLSDVEQLNESVALALENGENNTLEVNIGDAVYRIDIQQIDEKWLEDFRGIALIVLFTDITEEFNSNRIRSEFFANASHELKTPLTAIKGYAELMTTVDDKDVYTKCITEINKNAGKMLSLIQDMLKLSKLDAKIIDEEFCVVDIRHECDEVVGNLMPLALANNITIHVDGNGKIWGMRNLIGEMIMNIVGNAIKYNRENGKVSISICEDADSLVFSVSDTGIGIPKHDLGRIFERFYLPDKGRNKKIMSTGLGLAIVKHIVMEHDATISVESEEGVGSTFSVRFKHITKEQLDSMVIPSDVSEN